MKPNAIEDGYMGIFNEPEDDYDFSELQRIDEQEYAMDECPPQIVEDYEKALEENKKLKEEKAKPQITVYKPLQLLTIYADYLASTPKLLGKIIYLEGIYQQGSGQLYGNGYFYDHIKDETVVSGQAATSITLLVPAYIRPSLKPGSLVVLQGGIVRRVKNSNGSIEIDFRVDKLQEKKKEIAISNDDIKRIELIQKKASLGRKNVSTILETKLMRDEHPKVLLLFAQTSITESDFNAGIGAAASQFNFVRDRVSFQSVSLSSKLRQEDGKGYDVICLIRGGGGGMEKLDDVTILETIVNMKTPTIAALGHVAERFSVKEVVDYPSSTPNGLGQYFSEMVERVTRTKEDSDAVRNARIKKLYEDQLKDKDKRIAELQGEKKNLDKRLTDSQNDSRKKQDEDRAKYEGASKRILELEKENVELKNSSKGVPYYILVIIVLLTAIIAFAACFFLFRNHYLSEYGSLI